MRFLHRNPPKKGGLRQKAPNPPYATTPFEKGEARRDLDEKAIKKSNLVEKTKLPEHYIN